MNWPEKQFVSTSWVLMDSLMLSLIKMCSEESGYIVMHQLVFDEYIKHCCKYYYRHKVSLCFCELDEHLMEVWSEFSYILLLFHVDGIFINEIKIHCTSHSTSPHLNIKGTYKSSNVYLYAVSQMYIKWESFTPPPLILPDFLPFWNKIYENIRDRKLQKSF